MLCGSRFAKENSYLMGEHRSYPKIASKWILYFVMLRNINTASGAPLLSLYILVSGTVIDWDSKSLSPRAHKVSYSGTYPVLCFRANPGNDDRGPWRQVSMKLRSLSPLSCISLSTFDFEVPTNIVYSSLNLHGGITIQCSVSRVQSQHAKELLKINNSSRSFFWLDLL